MTGTTGFIEWGNKRARITALESISERQRVYSNSPQRDKTWRAQCANGHWNDWDTLRWVVISIYWCDDCCDEHEHGEYRCQRCDEVMKGGTTPPDPNGTWIPSMTEIRIQAEGDGEPPELGGTVAFEMGSMSGNAILLQVERNMTTEGWTWSGGLVVNGEVKVKAAGRE